MAEEGSNRSRTVLIVVGVIGALGLLSCVACGAAGMFCAAEMPSAHREPPRVDAALYMGSWTGPATTLVVSESHVQFETGGDTHIAYNGTFDGISGQDILIGMVVTNVALDVTDPPHVDPATGRRTMTVEGVRLEQ